MKGVGLTEGALVIGVEGVSDSNRVTELGSSSVCSSSVCSSSVSSPSEPDSGAG